METITVNDSLEVQNSKELLHGCHLECQTEAEYPIMACGIIAEWSEGFQGTNYEKCEHAGHH